MKLFLHPESGKSKILNDVEIIKKLHDFVVGYLLI